MRIILKGILILLVFSCSTAKEKQDDIVTISGIIKNRGMGEVILEKIENNALSAVDTLSVNEDGTYYTYYQPDEPAYYRLNFFQTQFVTFIFSGEPIIINVDGSGPRAPFEIKGSEEVEVLNVLNTMMVSFNSEVTKLNEEFGTAANDGDTEKMETIRMDFEQRQANLNEGIKEKIRETVNSIMVIQALNYLDKDKEFPFVDSVARVVDKNLPDYRIKRDFIAEVEQLRRLAIGADAPEIELPNPEGEMVKLSSLKGSVVLIDFWAAWCGPCRRENPNVVRLYNQYNDQGFTVFGVSLDRKKEDWVKAIEKDGLVWTHVSDLQYFNSKAAQDYRINAIPATYLIDKDGKIIGKNLRGESLEAKLKEIFG